MRVGGGSREWKKRAQRWQYLVKAIVNGGGGGGGGGGSAAGRYKERECMFV